MVVWFFVFQEAMVVCCVIVIVCLFAVLVKYICINLVLFACSLILVSDARLFHVLSGLFLLVLILWLETNCEIYCSVCVSIVLLCFFVGVCVCVCMCVCVCV